MLFVNTPIKHVPQLLLLSAVTVFVLNRTKKGKALGYSKTCFKSMNRIYCCARDYDYSHKNLWDLLLTKFFLIVISLIIKHITVDWNSSFLKKNIIWFIVYKTLFFNPFQVNALFLYSWKLQENNAFLTFQGV